MEAGERKWGEDLDIFPLEFACFSLGRKTHCRATAFDSRQYSFSRGEESWKEWLMSDDPFLTSVHETPPVTDNSKSKSKSQEKFPCPSGGGGGVYMGNGSLSSRTGGLFFGTSGREFPAFASSPPSPERIRREWDGEVVGEFGEGRHTFLIGILGDLGVSASSGNCYSGCPFLSDFSGCLRCLLFLIFWATSLKWSPLRSLGPISSH